MASSKEHVILGSVTFLVVILLCSSTSTSIVSAKPVKKGPVECNNSADNLKITCCQTQTSTNGQAVTYCTTCDNTSPPSNCGPRFIKQENPPPSVGPAQPPSTPPTASNLTSPPVSSLPTRQQTTLTTTCPDGSAPAANGNCPSANTPGQGTTQSTQIPPTGDNSIPSKHHKGSGGTTTERPKGSDTLTPATHDSRP